MMKLSGKKWKSSLAVFALALGISPFATMGEPPRAFADTVTVNSLAELQDRINDAPSSGRVITLAANTYLQTTSIYIENKNNITIQGETSDYRDTVVKGISMMDGLEINFRVNNSDNITIQNMTIRDSYYHAVQITSGSDNFHAKNLLTWDNGSAAFKVASVPSGLGLPYADNGLIEDCVIGYTYGGHYSVVEGIDIVAGNGWIIRNNVFENIVRLDGGEAYAAFAKGNAQNTLMENNIVKNSFIGLSLGGGGTFGDWWRDGDTTYEERNGIIRNNIIINSYDVGIYLNNAHNFKVYNNTVINVGEFNGAIEYRFAGSSGQIRNNLVSSDIRARDGGTATLSNNVINATDSLFVDPANYNYHLKSTSTVAINQGVALIEVEEDIDGQIRPNGSAFDIGADEYSTVIPTPVPRPTPPRPTPDPDPRGTNLAYNKPAFTDAFLTNLRATYANDGTTLTYWNAPDDADHWWSVDLGQNYNLGTAEVIWGYQDDFKYRIEVSSDNVNWTTVVDQTSNTTVTQVNEHSITANARYARVTVYDGWPTISEFKLFESGSTPPPAGSTIFGNSTSGIGAEPGGIDYNLGTRFQPNTDGEITALRVFAPFGESGDHTAYLFNNDTGQSYGPWTWNYTGDNTWKTFTLPTPIDVFDEYDYTVSVSTGTDSGRVYAYKSGHFASAGSNADLSWFVGSGVFGPKDGTRPTTTFNNSSYMRDVVFEPGGPTTPPPTGSTIFGNSTTGIVAEPGGYDYNLGTRFQPNTDGEITALRVFAAVGEAGDHTAYLFNNDTGQTFGPWTWNYTGDNTWKTFTLPTPIDVYAAYDYTVSVSTGTDSGRVYPIKSGHFASAGSNSALSWFVDSGVFGPKDNTRPTSTWNSSSYMRDVVFESDGTTTSSSIFDGSTTGIVAEPGGYDYNLGTRFQPNTDGEITALRVFAAVGESGDHTAYLFNNDTGQTFGPWTWNYTGDNTWKTFTLPTPIDVDAAYDYTVSVSTGTDSGRVYPIKSGHFASAGSNSGLSWFVDSGVFGPKDNTRPTSTWNSSSYMRDVVFVPQ